MYGLIQRSLDILVSAMGLMIFAPLMAAIAAWIRIDSPGPVIFRQNRVGLCGKIFTLYKFRTMRTDTDPYGFSPKDESDPRVTPSGKFLRKYSLDELPQLMNVLMGKMTLVGPRPLLPWQYERWTDRQKKRCDVKPGLTGWAQVSGRGALTHEDKIELDLWYIEHMGLKLDLKILWMTIFRVLRSEDVLEVKYSREESESQDKSKESH
jgi:sugar transferase EpsL